MRQRRKVVNDSSLAFFVGLLLSNAVRYQTPSTTHDLHDFATRHATGRESFSVSDEDDRYVDDRKRLPTPSR